MADLKQITLPSGTTYNIVDQGARDLIAALEGSTAFLGVTTTALTDGATTNPITINGSSVTATNGNIVVYGNAEFIFDGTHWIEFGDLSSLGDLAYSDSASGSFTPAGSVSQPTFTGTQGNISASYTPAGSVAISTGSGTANYTPEGTVSQPSFTGTQGNISASYTPAGTVAISTGTGTANYTPAGTVTQPTFTGTQGNISASYTPVGSVTVSIDATQVPEPVGGYTPSGSVSTPTITVTPATTTVNSITDVGTLPSVTMPVLTMTVQNEVLTFGWTAGSYTAGTLPTKGADTTVMTGATASSTKPSFTGNSVQFHAGFTGTEGTATGTFTPAGTVSQPTFSGTGAELKATFSGTAGSATGTFTPAGTVSQPSFTGTGAELTATFTGTAGNATGTFTPAGTVSQPSFTGTAGTVTVTGD